MIYLDSAATTFQKPPSVVRAMAEAMGTVTSPGRGDHGPAARASRLLLALREEAAGFFGVGEPERVVLTTSATHGLNIAVKSLVRPGMTVLLSGLEHNAVTRPLAAIPGVRIRTLEVPLFQPDQLLETLEEELEGQVDVMICTHASNVFGYILPVEEIAQLCRLHQVPLIVDASQSAGLLPVDLEGWGAAFVAMPGHKALYGPQGTGLLLCGAEAAPLLEGGTGSESRRQEMPDFLPDRLEAGTHNMPGAAGLLAGLRFVRGKRPGMLLRHEVRLKELAAEGLARLPGVRVFRGRPGTQSGVLSFQVAGRDPGEMGERLARQGVALRSGLHCAPLAHRTGGTEEAGTLRLSFSAFNTQREVGKFLAILARQL